jgi:hypothetical protein
MMLRKANKAEDYVNRAAQINPGYPGIQFYKALLLALKGEKKKALLLKKNGIIYSLLGMKEEAIKYIQRVIRKGNEHFQYSYLPLVHSTFYEELRNDARFEDVLKRQKLKYDERMKKYGKF